MTKTAIREYPTLSALGVPAPSQVPVELVTSSTRATELIEELANSGTTLIAVDTETVIYRDAEGLPIPRNLNVFAKDEGPGECRVISIAARLADGVKAWVLDMGWVSSAAISAMARLKPFMWNKSFDRLVLRRLGVKIAAYDLMLGESLLRTGEPGALRHSTLADVAFRELGVFIGGKKSTRLDYRPRAERENLTDDEIKYAAADAIVTLYLGLKLGPQLEAALLTDTFFGDCAGEPWVTSMEWRGFHVDGDGYRADLDTERAMMDAAGAQIALATTAGPFLEELHQWKCHHLQIPSTTESASKAGLEVFNDPGLFGHYLADLRSVMMSAENGIAETLGVTEQVDLFAEEDGATFRPMPFDLNSDVTIKKWFTKQLPQFAAAWAISHREADSGTAFHDIFEARMGCTFEELKEIGGRAIGLVKAHELETVLSYVCAGLAGADDDTIVVAQHLLRHRSAAKTLAKYGQYETDLAKAVLVPDWDVNSSQQMKGMFNTYLPDLVVAFTARTSGKSRLFEEQDSVDKDTMKLMVQVAQERGLGEETLPNAILEFRKRSKTISTYGDELLKRINPVTGRVHARYDQCLTGTGRLNSSKPNAQNLSPLLKKYMGAGNYDQLQAFVDIAEFQGIPSRSGVRVLVASDLSQAELRYLAHLAGDVEMLAAFEANIDLHTRTASLMFGIDLFEVLKLGKMVLSEAVLKVSEISQYAAEFPDMTCADLVDMLRQKAKAVAFGYAYGLKGKSLANQLTVQGVPTTKEEADDLLRKFDLAYPQVAAWMDKRVQFVDTLANNMRNMRLESGVDFTATWLLHNIHGDVRRAFKVCADNAETEDDAPTWAEVAQTVSPELKGWKAQEAALWERVDTLTDEEKASLRTLEETIAAKTEQLEPYVSWAFNYRNSVVLRPDGTPWQFESRTLNNRRRVFQVDTKSLAQNLVQEIVYSKAPNMRALRDEWVGDWNDRKAAEHEAKRSAGGSKGAYKPFSLYEAGKTVSREVLEKRFKDQKMYDDLVNFALQRVQADQMEKLWRAAMAQGIRRMSNMYRNQPIQGGVADAVTAAFGSLYEALDEAYPTALPTQSVHDSIVIECDLEDAIAIRDILVQHMEAGLARFCPSVVVRADGDIHRTLDKAGKLTDAEVASWLQELQSSVAA